MQRMDRAMTMVARAVAMAIKRATARVPRVMATATKKAMAMVVRLMATATKRAMAREGNSKGRKRFGNSDSGGGQQKREMARAATGNGYGKEGGGHSMVATMGTAQRTWLLML